MSMETLRGILFVIYLTDFASVHGCGQLPAGQEKTINFTISGFNLPPPMVYSMDAGASSLVPNISTSEQGARTFLLNFIMSAVDDVLYQQGRGAGLSDDVISLILQQLTLEINYNPLQCIKVFTTATANAPLVVAMMTNCQIIGGTVTNICMPAANCDAAALKLVPSEYLNIPGSLKTSNIIMANWSREMWQSVLNRILRVLSSGSFASNFNRASVTLN